MVILVNELETARFGIRAARVTDTEAQPDTIDTTARDAGVTFINMT